MVMFDSAGTHQRSGRNCVPQGEASTVGQGPTCPRARSVGSVGSNSGHGQAEDAYREVEALWRGVRDYESLCRPPHVSAPWRCDLLEDCRADPRCERVLGAKLEAYAVHGTPAGDGVFLFPTVLSTTQQKALLQELVSEWAHPPNRSNLWQWPGAGSESDNASASTSSALRLQEAVQEFATVPEVSHSSAGGDELGAGLLEHLRWVTLGRQYDWSERIYLPEESGQALPSMLQRLAEAVVATLALPPDVVRPFDTAICNLYHAARRPSDRLGGHKDDVERDTSSPLVAVSVGLPGIFLLGGETRSERPTPILLTGGSVLVLVREARQAFHGIPTVLVPPRLQLRGRAPKPDPPGGARRRCSHVEVYFPGERTDVSDEGIHASNSAAASAASLEIEGLPSKEQASDGPASPVAVAIDRLLTRARVSFSIRAVGL